MNLIDNHFRNVPEYYPYMYLDGYTPEEIMYASHKNTIKKFREKEEAKRAEAEANEVPEVKIIS